MTTQTLGENNAPNAAFFSASLTVLYPRAASLPWKAQNEGVMIKHRPTSSPVLELSQVLWREKETDLSGF